MLSPRLALYLLFAVALCAFIRLEPLPAYVVQSRQFPDPGSQRPRERDAIEEKMEEQRKKEMNKQRMEALRKDADKLFHLSTELKDYVDKTDEHTLSIDVIRKAEEVEKLAKRVKEKMKETY